MCTAAAVRLPIPPPAVTGPALPHTGAAAMASLPVRGLGVSRERAATSKREIYIPLLGCVGGCGCNLCPVLRVCVRYAAIYPPHHLTITLLVSQVPLTVPAPPPVAMPRIPDIVALSSVTV
jgi:hypothetical protein